MPSARHLAALGLVRWQRPAAQVELPVAVAAGAPSPPRRAVVSSAAKAEPAATPTRAVEAAPASTPGVALLRRQALPMAADPDLAARVARMDWSTLRAELARRSRPPATQGVFGVGAEDAPLFVIGEAPGADEDRLGEPFVGRAGKLLDAMLGAIGHERRRNVYIANICKFRPPDNRDPRPEEIAEDLPILLRQIALVQPRILLAVGRIAAQTLLDCDTPIGRLRGQLHQHPASGLPLAVTYHPAYLLRSPLQKVKAWDDLKAVRRHLRES